MFPENLLRKASGLTTGENCERRGGSVLHSARWVAVLTESWGSGQDGSLLLGPAFTPGLETKPPSL